MIFSKNDLFASFEYNGERVELIPAQMRPTAPGAWEKTLPDGMTALLTVEAVAPDAALQLLRFVHRGRENSGTLARVRSFERRFPAVGGLTYESITGDDCGASSYAPREVPLRPGERFTAAPRDGRPSDGDVFPFFDLRTAGGAATFGIGWSGRWILELGASGDTGALSVGLAETETFLYPGEEIRTDYVFFVTAADVPSARRRFRRLLLDRFAPRDPGTGACVRLPVAETNFDRYFRRDPTWDTAAGQKRCADIAAACGMDTLWLDAAWFREGFPGGVGNFDYAPGFPRGTGEVAAYAHEKGLRYLQWFEPERANAYSDTLRDFRADVILPAERDRVNCLVNIGEPRVYDRVTATLKRHIRNDGIDVFRVDHNISPLAYWRSADGPGRKGMTELRCVEALYRMWDEIRAEFPRVLIDNCASGGRRIDFETTRRAVPLWRSDTGCTDETADRRPAEWSQNQTLGLTRYLPYHSGGAWNPKPYFMRSAAAGGVACNFDVFSPDFDPAAVRPVIEETLRLQKYWAGDFYPLTPPTNAEDVFIAWQLRLENAGAAYVFRRRDCGEDAFRLSPAGIDPAGTYRVRVTDEDLRTTEETLSGAALESRALTLPAPRSSASLEYEKQN